MAENKAKLNRRNFLLAVGAGGAATAAAIAAKAVPQSAPKLAANDKRATRGYVASEHVNSYYRTTKV
jgi:shikimate 5-dehydrogenase